ncbi:MAG: twin-arginine translocase TatA/TatE family subunit [Sphaerochaetaceae bacterium]|nr:twin-arginine translocase TatA/TatE family subunit [Sphaerochaetaceae bacterium]MDC7236890.1 twin-arginine translocase TatA/TatE family subunit [Sphaerochaetaceae bacterium]MDC7243495.1 twin-arginine translocase TatA/TatE family subunit [Sphaerochaetaceae bacterium]MDC7249449.1 twin-arginine translocase TatA/TatE family subunit [Sphaerochaetaceae bacterium]
MIGTTEVIVICGVVVLLFGASALPKFARNIGKARMEFDKGMKEARDLSNAQNSENITNEKTSEVKKD